MYEPIENPVEPEIGRMWISRRPRDVGPSELGDTVTVRVAKDVELYVAIEDIEGTTVRGEVLAIGPKPQERFENWEYGSKVEFPEPFVTCIFRGG